MKKVWDLQGRERDEVIFQELRHGSLPGFLRHLKAVRLESRDRRGVIHEAVICVMPDYLAVGSDDDFVRVPLGFRAAVDTARQFESILPTRKMVDAIYRQAARRLTPQPMKPTSRMVSTQYFVEHNRTIERQRGDVLGVLMSGHKKDLILTKRLLTRRRRVAIYGWHEKPGRPIQPLSTVHGARYADYSHGVRLVSATVLLDGSPRSVYEILRDSNVAQVLTYEGTIRDAARIMRAETATTKKSTD
ncbi:MAG TPA: hypothetical protein VLK65_18680 [Vicinamibacteria bacterium]|nr:hypothetical protein [Vicinamibacteria bacterium]